MLVLVLVLMLLLMLLRSRLPQIALLLTTSSASLVRDEAIGFGARSALSGACKESRGACQHQTFRASTTGKSVREPDGLILT